MSKKTTKQDKQEENKRLGIAWGVPITMLLASIGVAQFSSSGNQATSKTLVHASQQAEASLTDVGDVAKSLTDKASEAVVGMKDGASDVVADLTVTSTEENTADSDLSNATDDETTSADDSSTTIDSTTIDDVAPVEQDVETELVVAEATSAEPPSDDSTFGETDGGERNSAEADLSTSETSNPENADDAMRKELVTDSSTSANASDNGGLSANETNAIVESTNESGASADADNEQFDAQSSVPPAPGVDVANDGANVSDDVASVDEPSADSVSDNALVASEQVASIESDVATTTSDAPTSDAPAEDLFTDRNQIPTVDSPSSTDADSADATTSSASGLAESPKAEQPDGGNVVAKNPVTSADRAGSNTAANATAKTKAAAKKPFLGVGIRDSKGTRVTTLYQPSTAHRLGIMVGDELVTLNDKKISNVESLRELLSQLKVGDKVNVTILRNGVNYTVGPAELNARN